MRVNIKKNALLLLAGASALTLGAAFLCMNAPVAHADEGSKYVAFYNVGANDAAKEIDTTLGLAEKGVTKTTEGTKIEGGTLFSSYANGASYTVALSGAEEYRVAVAVKKDAKVKIDGADVAIPTDAGENVVVSAKTSKSSVTVEVDGKVCAILADDAAGDATLLTADYTEGQVIPYGALLADVLENATGYYSNGETKELKIQYGDINGGTGVNVNFTTVDVTGTVEGTKLAVNRYLTTMPDELVYFINGGSHDYDNGRWEKSADPYFAYNQTIFDYYKNGSGALINDGTPDRKAPNANEWGWYGNTESAVTHTASALSFPYSSVRCMDRDNNAMLGYYLTGLSASTQYRIWIGTLSPWHARTVSITFNGQVVGADNLRINSSKGFTVFENVTPNASGKIDINMKGASTNEPCFAFIAVQKMETKVDAIPSALTGDPTVGTEATSVFVQGVKEGAKLQIYNAAKPNQIIHEEMADLSKVTQDGYEISWGQVLTGISQFNVVQITNGGVSAPLLISITDIKFVGDDNKHIAWMASDAYTTDSVTIKVAAEASSGIVSWSYRLGQYGAATVENLDRPLSLDTSFTVNKNGTYYVVVASGLGVTYEEEVVVDRIESEAPVITITPSVKGWQESSYNVDLTVTSVAPVVEYKLLQNGKVCDSGKSAPTDIEFTEAGEYTIYVKTASGRTAMSTIQVSNKPTVTKITSAYANRTRTYTFGGTDDYKIDSVVVYQLLKNKVERKTISSGNKFNVFEAGSYVAIVKTTTGAVEMFSFTVDASELKAPNTRTNTGSNSGLGIGIGVGVGGVVIAAVAIVVTLVLLKKKQPVKAVEAKKSEEPHQDDKE